MSQAREEQAAIEQQEWQAMQQQANMCNPMYQQQAMMGYTPPPAGTHYQLHNNPQANIPQVQQGIFYSLPVIIHSIIDCHYASSGSDKSQHSTTTTYECQLIVVYSCPGGTDHGFKVFNRMDFLPFIIPV